MDYTPIEFDFTASDEGDMSVIYFSNSELDETYFLNSVCGLNIDYADDGELQDREAIQINSLDDFLKARVMYAFVYDSEGYSLIYDSYSTDEVNESNIKAVIGKYEYCYKFYIARWDEYADDAD